MQDYSKYHFPEFIANALSNDNVLSETDLDTIEEIYLQSENFVYPSARTESNWQKLNAKVETAVLTPKFTISKNSLTKIYFKWAVAAAILISFTIGIIQYNRQFNSYQPLVITSSVHLKQAALPDGSLVTLNTFSSLSTNDFDSDQRVVTLQGEAYFDVKHNSKPFIVKTDAGNIVVMGTKFNIKSRVNLPFQVALSSGSISLTTSQGTYQLHPGDVLTKNAKNFFIKSEFNTNTLSWLEDKLVFENESLGNIITALENQYNVTLEYDSKLKSEKLTLTFNKLTAEQAAELLSKTLNSRVVVK